MQLPTAIIGTGPVMQQVFADLRSTADVDIPVLFVGESGTGKRLLARYVHEQSSRRNGPFIIVQCSGLPKDLLYGELFGHEKGSFGGAYTQRKGQVELARNGSILLEAITELPLTLQTRLASFIGEGSIQRLGGNERLTVNSRLLAATHVDPNRNSDDAFLTRELYLRFLQVDLPPLRARPEDIPLLTDVFVKKYTEKYQKTTKGLSREVYELLGRYDYPGNVQELETLVERAVLLAKTGYLTCDDFPMVVARLRPPGHGSTTGAERAAEDTVAGINLNKALVNYEKELIVRALTATKGVKSRAAEFLSINRTTLIERMKRLRLTSGGDDIG
jgi:DNA-binding NtrC family response regulator